jgi:hypothetical protein
LGLAEKSRESSSASLPVGFEGEMYGDVPLLDAYAVYIVDYVQIRALVATWWWALFNLLRRCFRPKIGQGLRVLEGAAAPRPISRRL